MDDYLESSMNLSQMTTRYYFDTEESIEQSEPVYDLVHEEKE